METTQHQHGSTFLGGTLVVARRDATHDDFNWNGAAWPIYENMGTWRQFAWQMRAPANWNARPDLRCTVWQVGDRRRVCLVVGEEVTDWWNGLLTGRYQTDGRVLTAPCLLLLSTVCRARPDGRPMAKLGNISESAPAVRSPALVLPVRHCTCLLLVEASGRGRLHANDMPTHDTLTTVGQLPKKATRSRVVHQITRRPRHTPAYPHRPGRLQIRQSAYLQSSRQARVTAQMQGCWLLSELPAKGSCRRPRLSDSKVIVHFGRKASLFKLGSLISPPR